MLLTFGSPTAPKSMLLIWTPYRFASWEVFSFKLNLIKSGKIWNQSICAPACSCYLPLSFFPSWRKPSALLILSQLWLGSPELCNRERFTFNRIIWPNDPQSLCIPLCLLLSLSFCSFTYVDICSQGQGQFARTLCKVNYIFILNFPLSLPGCIQPKNAGSFDKVGGNSRWFLVWCRQRGGGGRVMLVPWVDSFGWFVRCFDSVSFCHMTRQP